MKKRDSRFEYGVLVVITLVLAVITVWNMMLIYDMTSKQTENIGKIQLKSIKDELQETVSDAENMTMRVAMGAEQLLADGASVEEITKFFIEQKAEQRVISDGVCINVYIANHEWAVIPDFQEPENFHATERVWYVGARENESSTFISPPYLDLATGDMCFTVSTLLSDQDTVVALDFNFSKVQESIQEMGSKGNGDALIVTKEGLILGYTDTSYVGASLNEKLPAYTVIFSQVKQENENSSFDAKLGGRKHTIFSSKTDNGWYLILSVNDWVLYKGSYQQMLLTSLLNLLMIVVIIIFYIRGCQSRLKAEKALAVKEEFLSNLSNELKEPLNRILKLSSYDVLEQSDNPKECVEQIKEAGLNLSGMMDNLFSYSTIVSADREHQKSKKRKNSTGQVSRVNRRVRAAVIWILVVAMVISIFINAQTTRNWGDTKMHREVDAYEYQLAEWISKQKSILEMFVDTIATNPELMDDYESAVEFLNGITLRYPEISVTYMTNPYKEHTVIMNNGWQPDADWKVEERQWYIDTEKSGDGFNISAPYYDEQTGYYCVTMSQMVYGKDGEFLGIFGIDFYLDKLIEILGASYTEDGYAFLVDGDGIIINHPNPVYQLSVGSAVNVQDIFYDEVYQSAEIVVLQDYDEEYKTCIAKHNETSNFTIIVVKDWWSIYGNTVTFGAMILLMFGICVSAVYYLMSRLLKWQREVNFKLEEAAEAAVSAGKAKSQFLAQMSHEIRTPINAVLGMNEMILRESGNDDIREYAQNIQSAGRTLLSLINSILDFSKIEDGKMEIIPVKYDTASLINDLVNMISDKAEKKDLLLKLEIDPNLPKTMYGDDVRVRQVITNILNNAVKYTQKGSVTLKIQGKMLDQDTILLYVAVSDTGIGIRREDMDKLFQSFQRLDEEKNHNIEGTGLGISIVQKLLNMMGSQLVVESVYGEGSTFSFELSQKIVELEPIGDYDRRRQISLEKKEKLSYLYAPEAKILVVDDNEMNLKVAAGLMKRCGIRPDLAASGKECLNIVSERQYDMIFLDHMMPGMDGMETLKRLREQDSLPSNTRVIALTANAIVGAREQYLEAGFDDYLSKPMDVEELEEKIAKYLPEEKVSYKDEKQNPSPEKTAEQERTEQERTVQETVDEDSFTMEQLKKLHEVCPELNVLTGLEYCGGSRMFYLEMLREYSENSKETEIAAAYEKEDMESYRILVHALKSTSLTIGAILLSEHAKLLENAAKAGDTDYIRTNHASVLQEYSELMEHITKGELW